MAQDVGVQSSVFFTSDPHWSFFVDAGISTAVYSAPAAASIKVLPTQTGPVTGPYDPEWVALMSIEA